MTQLRFRMGMSWELSSLSSVSGDMRLSGEGQDCPSRAIDVEGGNW